MNQLLFDLCTARPRLLARLAQRVRTAVVRRHNPEVRDRLEGRTLVVPLSHDLAWNRMHHPTYTDNLRRVAEFVRRRDGRLAFVDVGANVGDSYLLTRPAPGDSCVLIEGSERYFGLLKRNVGGDPGVRCVYALLSDVPGEAAGSMVVEGGNARVEAQAGGRGAAFDTLDRVLERQAGFGPANLLKVDVEGWDGRVLRGGRALLSAAAPVVIFEHHPRLIALTGEDDRRLFGELAALGYGLMIVYDNRGFLLGTLDPADTARATELVSYARQQDGYYFDVIAFPAARSADRDAFLAGERAFADALFAAPRPA